MTRPPRHHRRRARQALVWAGVTFLLAQLTAGLVLDYRWPEVKFPSATRTLETLRLYPRPPEILCLGSSRFGGAFNESEIRDLVRQETGDEDVMVFNGSIEAGDLVTADFVLARMLEQGTCPRLLIVEVSPETVARRNSWLGQHLIRQLAWDDIPGAFRDICRSHNFMRLLSTRLMPLYVHRRQICKEAYRAYELARVAPQKARTIDIRPGPSQSTKLETTGVQWDVLMGLNQPFPTPPERTQTGLGPIRRWLTHYRTGGTAGAAMKRLLARCRQHGIEVILVGVPVSAPHRQLYTPDIERQFQAYIGKVTERYGCRFVDYRDQVPDSLFLDNHHVIKAGGVYFSRRLAREVIIPAWQQRRQAVASGS